jgi:hypothetical protein
VWKRSVDAAPQLTMRLQAQLGFFSLWPNDQHSHVFKYQIYKEEEITPPASSDQASDSLPSVAA